MSSVTLPVTRPAGRALLIAGGGYRERPLGVLSDLGFTCGEVDDPYRAMAELARRPSAYRALILSLQSVYKEELSVITVVRRRFPRVEIWLTDTDGRQGALAEAMRLGAAGLLADDGLHRIADALPPQPSVAIAPSVSPARAVAASTPAVAPASNGQRMAMTPRRPARELDRETDAQSMLGEPVLTAEELRALLHEPMATPGKAE